MVTPFQFQMVIRFESRSDHINFERLSAVQRLNVSFQMAFGLFLTVKLLEISHFLRKFLNLVKTLEYESEQHKI